MAEDIKITGGGKGALANITPQSGVLVDEKTNSGILANMEKLASEIQNPWRKLNEGLKDVTAWTQYNKGPAFALREEAANTDRANLYNIRQQQAAYQEAQLQAQAEAANIARFKQGITGGAGGAGGANMAQQQLLSAMDTLRPNQVGAQRALIDEYNKQQILGSSKAQYDAANIKQDNYFYPGIGNVTMSANDVIGMPKDVSQEIAAKRMALLRGNPPTEGAPTVGAPTMPATTGGTNAPSAATPAKAVAMPKTDVPLEGLPTPFYAQESSSGKKDTSKPGIQNAQGPMQVTKDTFDTYKKKGIIPASYELNDPGQAYASGVLILNDLHKKHGQDVNKIAAEYFGGPGAINADGSINVNRPDANGKTVGAYVNDIRARMKLPPIDLAAAPADTAVNRTAAGPSAAGPSAAAKPPPPVGTASFVSGATSSNVPQFSEPEPVSGGFRSKVDFDAARASWEKRRDVALKVFEEQQKQLGSEELDAYKNAQKAFIDNTSREEIRLRETNTDKLDAWMTRWGDNKRVLEVLSKPELSNAIADALKLGVSTPVGGFSIPGIERIVQAGLPGLKGEEVTALKELDTIMGPRIFQIVKQSKGSSSDKDMDAFIKIAGSSSTGYDFLNKAIKYDRVSLKMDKEDRALYNSLIKPNQPTDFRMFDGDPRRQPIYDEYQKEVKNIAAMKHEKKQVPSRPAGMPKNVPAQWSASTQSFWIGDKEYKVK